MGNASSNARASVGVSDHSDIASGGVRHVDSWGLLFNPVQVGPDIKSFAMAVLGTEYRESTKRNMPKGWFDDLPHTHVALDDAKGQGALFCNMLAANRRR